MQFSEATKNKHYGSKVIDYTHINNYKAEQ